MVTYLVYLLPSYYYMPDIGTKKSFFVGGWLVWFLKATLTLMSSQSNWQIGMYTDHLICCDKNFE